MKLLNEIDLNKLSSQEKHELIIKKCEEIEFTENDEKQFGFKHNKHMYLNGLMYYDYYGKLLSTNSYKLISAHECNVTKISTIITAHRAISIVDFGVSSNGKILKRKDTKCIVIKTKNGIKISYNIYADDNQWVVYNDAGDYYPCSNVTILDSAIFEKYYKLK